MSTPTLATPWPGSPSARAVGRPIEHFVTDEVLQPLGLTSTFFDNAVPAGIQRATGYSLDPEGRWTPKVAGPRTHPTSRQPSRQLAAS